MLSRVAERIYWGARYLERVENTARLISVYDNLLFDLPKDTNISWYNLITINSNSALFSERYKVKDEHNVVKFLLADDSNPSSMLSALKQAKENIRTTRDVVPQDTWELINELHLYAKNHIRQGINRRNRHEFLNTIIKFCQEITGLFEGEMSRDATWQFVVIGRNLERADMTSRILDAGTAAMMQPMEDSHTKVSQVIWGNVLRSVSGYMNYRRAVRAAVKARRVAQFLIEDPHFPRTLHFCLSEMENASLKLPSPEPVLTELYKVKQMNYDFKESDALGEPFRDYLNDVQIAVSDLHAKYSENWFAFNLNDEEVVEESNDA